MRITTESFIDLRKTDNCTIIFMYDKTNKKNENNNKRSE